MLWNKKLNKAQEDLNKLTQEFENFKTEVNTNKNSVDERLKPLEETMAEYFNYLKRKQSEEPFIEVISESFDEKAGIQIKLDWNDAMINYLKRNGYRGVTDDEIIEKYVSDVFNDRAKNAPDPIT